jgi:nitroreductase
MDAKACADLIAKRRMIKPSSMSEQPVPDSAVEAILEAGNWAPSHRLTEPWRFVVVEGEARQHLGRLFEAAYVDQNPEAREFTRQKVAAKPLRTSVLIAVLCHPSDLAKVKLHEEEWAVACAVQNMSLQATALGLSLFWSSGSMMDHPSLAQAFGCTARGRLMGCLHLGYPGDEGWPEGRRGAWREKVHWCKSNEIDVPTWRPNPGTRSET